VYAHNYAPSIFTSFSFLNPAKEWPFFTIFRHPLLLFNDP
jgi:hypothetical protein